MKEESLLTKSKYRYYEGDLSQGIDIARHSANLESTIVRRAFCDDLASRVLPLNMFSQDVNGLIQKRLEPVGKFPIISVVCKNSHFSLITSKSKIT